jgi:hypothetical protein
VVELAAMENWKAKLSGLSANKGTAKDIAVQINRAVIFGHAHRMRTIIGNLIQELHDDPEHLRSYLEIPTKGGTIRSFKALLDLSKALESVSCLAQRALGDTPDERPKGAKGEGVADITSSVLDALAHAAGGQRDHIKEQLNAPSTASGSE